MFNIAPRPDTIPSNLVLAVLLHPSVESCYWFHVPEDFWGRSHVKLHLQFTRGHISESPTRNHKLRLLENVKRLNWLMGQKICLKEERCVSTPHICHLDHLFIGGEKIGHVEKFQISIHDRCGEIWNFSTCRGISLVQFRPRGQNWSFWHSLVPIIFLFLDPGNPCISNPRRGDNPYRACRAR